MTIPEYKAQIGGGIILAGIALLLLLVIIPAEIVFVKQQLGVSPRYFPNVLASLLLVLSIALAGSGYRNRNRKLQRQYVIEWRETKLVVITLTIIGLQIVGFQLVGYLIPAMAAIAACMVVYGHRNYITVAVVSVLLPVGIKLFFEKTLHVFLP